MSVPNILIVDDEEEIREIVSFFVESSCACDISLAVNGEEAITCLKNKKFDLIICDYNMPVKNGGEVYKYLIESKTDCKYVMCSSDTPQIFPEFQDSTHMFGNIVKPNIMNGVKEVLARLKENQENSSPSPDQVYFPIGIKLLLSIRDIPVDIFIKLSEGKFIKVFSQGGVFDETDFLKYQQKDISKLYALNFTTDILVQKVQGMIEKISLAHGKSNKGQAVVETQDLILSTFKEYGFQEGLISAVELQIQDTLKICGSDKTLSLLINKMLKLKGSYISRHSFMLSAVTVSMANIVGWNSETTAQKLVISSLFHDVYLKEDVLNEVQELEGKKYDEDFKTHPQKAAELLDKIPRVPPDTGRIVLEQHEVGQGSGIPRSIAVHETTPLGQLFTFSHFLVDAILESQQNGVISTEEIYQKLEKISHQSIKYKKFLALLKEANIF